MIRPNRTVSRRVVLGLSTATAAALVLAGCSPAASSSDGKTTLTVRLWDDSVAKAYRTSFDAFEKKNPDIRVKINTVGWADYWTKLPTDVASGSMDDIYWMNSANYAQYADTGNLLEIGSDVGEESQWVQSVNDIYTRDGKLWGVPQLWDSIALYYNKDLVAKAGIDPSTLKWSPDGGGDDTFLAAVKKLTVDENGVTADQPGFDSAHIAQYGFNSQYDLQAILGDFIGSNGGKWMDGDRFAFDSPEGVAATKYAVDLVTEHHVSPSAADTASNGDLARDLFSQGKMALFQSGPYSLTSIADTLDPSKWAIAPMVEGPSGRVSVVHGVVAVGNAKTDHREATEKLLTWLGSSEGQKAVAESGAGFPGANADQDIFVDAWKQKGVDVSPFIEASKGETLNPGNGLGAIAGLNAVGDDFTQMWSGQLGVEKGMADAQKKANAAVAKVKN